MACHPIMGAGNKVIGCMCVRGAAAAPKKCAYCKARSHYLCDFPAGDGRTCDKRLCIHHATAIGPDVHHCSHHRTQPQQGALL